MSPEALDAACRALPGVTHVVQWGGSDVYKVGGKVFAIAGLGGGLTFKATPMAYEILTEIGRARRAPYLTSGNWLTVDGLEALEDSEVADWLATSHSLVAAKLTRLLRRELGLG